MISKIRRNESNVSQYCIDFPALFTKAKGEFLWDSHGGKYIDLFSATGSLNYGHNHPALVEALISTIEDSQLIQSLDLYTPNKSNFIEKFNSIILHPRKLRYKYQFGGPTGASAIEAAILLTRKVTGRKRLVSFKNSYHGMTQGARAISDCIISTRKDVTILPFFTISDCPKKAISLTKKILLSLKEKPASIFIEIMQGEGGVFLANVEWLNFLYAYCSQNGILLVIDDIQAGCGRSGSFFSFDEINIKPDIVCLSKSLSGIGLPMSMLLISSKYDAWESGEYSGTFRGNGLAYSTATKALDFWSDSAFLTSLGTNIILIEKWASSAMESKSDFGITDIRGAGMMWGIEYKTMELAQTIRLHLFEKRIIAEVVGKKKNVLRLLPPLNISNHILTFALNEIIQSSSECVKGGKSHG